MCNSSQSDALHHAAAPTVYQGDITDNEMRSWEISYEMDDEDNHPERTDGRERKLATSLRGRHGILKMRPDAKTDKRLH